MSGTIRPAAGRPPSRTAVACALAAILGAGIVPGLAHAQGGEVHALEVTPGKGTAPLGVMLTGPASFVAQAYDFIFTHGACSVAAAGGTQVFAIDWGDNAQKTADWPPAANPECKLTHNYTAPGTYRIRVGFFPASGGAPAPEWQGEATITVAAP
jgi:hypothetical protein